MTFTDPNPVFKVTTFLKSNISKRCILGTKLVKCCNLRSADLHSLDFTYNILFMKLFRTKSIDVVKDCQYFFDAVLLSVLVLRKADKLALRYQCLENAFCTYCRAI